MPDFYQRLLTETEQQRSELLSLPFIQHGAKGELALESYVAFLAQAYHHVKHTTPLLMACGSRIPHDKEEIRNAMAEYIEEEVGHQEWILNDINACGSDAEAVRNSQPGFAADVMCSYAYNMVDRRNPLGFLGMVLVLEGTSIRVATAAAEKLQSSLNLPNTAFSYLSSHGSLDISHMDFYEKLVNQINDPADQQAIINAAKRFYVLYGNVFRDLPLVLLENSHAA